MKAKVCAAIDAWAAKVEALAQDIEREPELGFKETKTAAKVTAFLQQLGLTPQTGLALTGVKARVVSGRPGPTVAVLGELDAIGCPDSKNLIISFINILPKTATKTPKNIPLYTINVMLT